MIISLVFDVIVGFLLHRLRPWSLTFENQREGSLIRYAIGLVSFCFLAPVNVAMQLTNVRDKLRLLDGWRYWFHLVENIFIGLLVTACAMGGGVTVGFLADGE